MADGFKVTLDRREWDNVFAALDGPVKESLARRMLVEGGVLLRDVAKAKAPKSDGPYTPYSRGSHQSGTLASAIYLAQDTDETSDTQYVYKITWNAKKAWWGKLVEFGYWRTHEVHRDNNGNFYTDMTKPLKSPIWVPPQAFLRSTIATQGGAAVKAMLDRGRREWPNLIGGIGQ